MAKKSNYKGKKSSNASRPNSRSLKSAIDALEVANSKMERNLKNQSNSDSRYGKKGFKPRQNLYAVGSSMNLDSIHTNDPRYWNKTEGYNRMTKFNWDLIIGNSRDISDVVDLVNMSGDVDYSKLTGNINPAQIMTLEFVYGPGWADDVNAGVNRGLAQMMADIRASLSTSNIGFETADLGIFVSSTGSIAVNIGLAKRALECVRNWHTANLNYPRGILNSMHMTWEDITSNFNRYSTRLNALIDMYNNMSILDIFDLPDRQYSMVHSIFADEDSELAQIYLFDPVGYYVYQDNASRAEWRSFEWSDSPDESNFEYLLDVINEQIQAWYTSSDLYQISGTLLRAFKDAPRQIIPHFSNDDQVTPVVDTAFLMQIMNCSIIGGYLGQDHNLDITQDRETQNYVIWKPAFPALGVNSGSRQILRIYENDVSQDDNAEMTRLLNFVDLEHPKDSQYYMTNCGSEIVTMVRTAVWDSNLNHLSYRGSYHRNAIVIGDWKGESPWIDNDYTLRTILMIQTFRYMPAMLVFCEYYDSDDNVYLDYLGFCGDVYNWKLYSYTDFKPLNAELYRSIWLPKISLR